MYERSRTVVRCAVVMDQLSEEVRQESTWTMMFADDIVICSESREQVEENLERWRFALERRGMKVSRIQSNGECGNEKISARIKGKVYRTVVRLAMLYGLETVSLRKRQESELEVAELKMLREARLRWFGHVQRRDTLVNSGAAINLIDHHLMEELHLSTQPCEGPHYPTNQPALPPESPSTSEPATIPREYHKLRDVFSKERATQLPPHCPWDCAIDLLPNTMPPKSRFPW
ncbi:hypothetical protein QTP86_008878 [Hemibagrus guttatus]|nr:hypothetical protein QTP86_008878 [Hemibagrus guttatus]